jgi:hypothetical protein
MTDDHLGDIPRTTNVEEEFVVLWENKIVEDRTVLTGSMTFEHYQVPVAAHAADPADDRALCGYPGTPTAQRWTDLLMSVKRCGACERLLDRTGP